MSFVVRVTKQATYRVVPEDSSLGAGLNVPYELAQMTGQHSDGRINVALRASGVATYLDGELHEIVVPDGWRVEEWPSNAQGDDSLVRQILDHLQGG